MVVWDGPTPLAFVRGGHAEWLLHDHLGSVHLATDANGKVTHTSEYDPFGVPEEAQRSATLAPSFSGLFHDSAVNGHLTLDRHFLSAIGGFLQPDTLPLGSAAGSPLYAYCEGDPVNLVDLNGAGPESPLDAWLDAHIEWLPKPRRRVSRASGGLISAKRR